MAKQEQSRDGMPRKDDKRPSPDVERYAADGQSAALGKGDSGEPELRPQAGERSSERHGESSQGDRPGKVGLTSDRQPDLVSPSGVNKGDHGAAEDKPMAGGSVNLDDDDMVRPRGKVTGQGGTTQAQGGDSGELAPPGAGLSDRNAPSDPDNRRK